MKKHGAARQVPDDNIIRRTRFACWVTKARYVILLFHGNNGYANAPKCQVTRTFPQRVCILAVRHPEDGHKTDRNMLVKLIISS